MFSLMDLPAMQEMQEMWVQDPAGGPKIPPELGGSPRKEHGNPLQYSFQENPMDRVLSFIYSTHFFEECLLYPRYFCEH